jgi:hypothetical protein
MPESKDKDQTSDPAVIPMLAEEMVAACRKAYEFDGEIEAPVTCGASIRHKASVLRPGRRPRMRRGCGLRNCSRTGSDELARRARNFSGGWMTTKRRCSE